MTVVDGLTGNGRAGTAEEEAHLRIFLEFYRSKKPGVLVALRDDVFLGERPSTFSNLKKWIRAFGLPDSSAMVFLAQSTLDTWQLVYDDTENERPENLRWGFELSERYAEELMKTPPRRPIVPVPYKSSRFSFEPMEFTRRFEPEGWQVARTASEAEKAIRQEFRDQVVASMEEELDEQLLAHREKWAGLDLVEGLVQRLKGKKVRMKHLKMLAEYQANEELSIPTLADRWRMSESGTYKALSSCAKLIGLRENDMRRASGGRPRKEQPPPA